MRGGSGLGLPSSMLVSPGKKLPPTIFNHSESSTKFVDLRNQVKPDRFFGNSRRPANFITSDMSAYAGINKNNLWYDKKNMSGFKLEAREERRGGRDNNRQPSGSYPVDARKIMTILTKIYPGDEFMSNVSKRSAIMRAISHDTNYKLANILKDALLLESMTTEQKLKFRNDIWRAAQEINRDYDRGANRSARADR